MEMEMRQNVQDKDASLKNNVHMQALTYKYVYNNVNIVSHIALLQEEIKSHETLGSSLLIRC